MRLQRRESKELVGGTGVKVTFLDADKIDGIKQDKV